MPAKPGASLLFDIDGTLVDSDPLHLVAFNEAFAPYGHSFDKSRFVAELQGRANEAIAGDFLPDLAHDDAMAVMAGKEKRFREIAKDGVDPVPGLLALLDWAKDHGVAVVAVTNAPRANAEMLLEALSLVSRFAHVVIGAELAHGKPHPLPYLEGLRLVGGRAEHAVAFEDSRAGMAAAKAAGIATVGIMTGLDEQQMEEAGVSLSVHDFADPRVLELVARTTLE